MMKHLILAPILSLALAVPAMAEKISLAQISNYLNSFQTAKGEFTQINEDGSVTTGEILIKRPGRVRFDYAPPDDSLVIAGGSQVAVFDPKSNVPPEQFPLSRTPLNLILARNVDFSRSNMVVAHRDDGTATIVKVQDPQHPEYGNIQLKFTANPVELRQWIITNDAGGQTTVILGDLQKGVQIGARPFNIPQEIQARGLN
ncbi:Outer membrane lipoprotein carrier protein LolA [Litoreibacter arenae DSM 19593]|uniref:Outer membrane lipoprotein carrier protein LolA n=2 Tax=Litoreibacter TaxID=947567 RepID=S9QDZ7_9RHOB|nr:Outer membrane lipoprotein carrier protein LolA [Litoreibacter arenae DSM 19593]